MKKKTSSKHETIIARITDSMLSIEELSSLVAEVEDAESFRRALSSSFDDLIDYETASDWNKVVRICEALAILGWGSLERVDAVAHFDGDHWNTFLINHNGIKRFRLGRWTKRKAGWSLFNPQYNESPDKPDRPSTDWMEEAGKDFAVVDSKSLASQRNKMRQVPFVISLSGSGGPASNAVRALRTSLRDLFTANLRPSIYGDAVDKIYLAFNCPITGMSENPAGLKVGAYRAKQRAFSCDLHFESGFADMSVPEQKAFVMNAVSKALDALEAKLATKKIEYNVDILRTDVELVFEAWRNS